MKSETNGRENQPRKSVVARSWKRSCVALLALALVLEAGCGRRPKQITSLQRKEAASLISEAEFAVSVRDLPRAEGLLAKVVTLTPDAGDVWVNLGSIRMRLGNRDGAKSAYESAFDAYGVEATVEKKDGSAALQQVYVLALLGRVDAARKLLEKVEKKYPDDPTIRSFVQEKQLDHVLADLSFKQISL